MSAIDIYATSHSALACVIEQAIIALVRLQLHQNYTFSLSDKLMTQPLEVKKGSTMSRKGGLPVTVVQRSSKQSGIVAAGACM